MKRKFLLSFLMLSWISPAGTAAQTALGNEAADLNQAEHTEGTLLGKVEEFGERVTDSLGSDFKQELAKDKGLVEHSNASTAPADDDSDAAIEQEIDEMQANAHR